MGASTQRPIGLRTEGIKLGRRRGSYRGRRVLSLVHYCCAQLRRRGPRSRGRVWVWRNIRSPGDPHDRVRPGVHLPHGLLPASLGSVVGPRPWVHVYDITKHAYFQSHTLVKKNVSTTFLTTQCPKIGYNWVKICSEIVATSYNGWLRKDGVQYRTAIHCDKNIFGKNYTKTAQNVFIYEKDHTSHEFKKHSSFSMSMFKWNMQIVNF